MTPTAPEFQRLRAGPRVLVVDAELEVSARALGLLERGGVERLLGDAGGVRGRAHTATVALPQRPERVLLRPVLHGGLLAPLLGGLLLGLGRPLRELETTARLAAAGAPVPRPALVVGWRRLGPLWNAVVGTLLEPDTVDAVRFLEAEPERARLLRAAEAAGVAVRRFHDAGGRHPDLHVKNLLVRERADRTEVVVIDLDKARRVEGVGPAARMKELMRLYRSLCKRRLLDAVGPRGCARFFEAYLGGDRDLRRALLARLGRERLRVAFHALGYPHQP